jgi:Fe2+ or Zn2+ uptake regulation protein
MEEAIDNFGKKHEFKIKSHEIELRGLCSDCS